MPKWHKRSFDSLQPEEWSSSSSTEKTRTKTQRSPHAGKAPLSVKISPRKPAKYEGGPGGESRHRRNRGVFRSIGSVPGVGQRRPICVG